VLGKELGDLKAGNGSLDVDKESHPNPLTLKEQLVTYSKVFLTQLQQHTENESPIVFSKAMNSPTDMFTHFIVFRRELHITQNYRNDHSHAWRPQ
jgi:hypothetical protein